MATIVYVDGFNLYYGALKGTPYKWLDLTALSRRLLPRDEIVQVRYFTAPVISEPNDRQQTQRQQTYLRALRTLPIATIHLGRFRRHVVRMRLANPKPNGPKTAAVVKTEEKGSDVNLATYLLLDAFKSRCDRALVVSNDSDLSEPIHVLEDEFGVEVGVANPHSRTERPNVLRASFYRQLRPLVLESCQLPKRLMDARGEINRPPGW